MDAFLGQILMWSGTYAPRGWEFCKGQIIPINENQVLFSVIGDIYGGDGRSTFGLPNLAGRVPVGAGTAPGIQYPLRVGNRGGTEINELSVENMPAHSHKLIGDITGEVDGDITGKVSGTVTPEIPLGSGTSTQADSGFLADASSSVGTGRDAKVTNFYTATAGEKKLTGDPIDLDKDIAITQNLQVQVSQDLAIGTTGESQRFDNRQPYIGINYIICMDGLYPPRP